MTTVESTRLLTIHGDVYKDSDHCRTAVAVDNLWLQLQFQQCSESVTAITFDIVYVTVTVNIEQK